VPRKQRPRARPPAARKKPRRHPLISPPAASSQASAATRPRVVPFTPRSTRAAESTAASPQVRTYDYSYVLPELRRIVIIGGAALLLVVILSFVLR
jgi:hypothetical protein